MADPYVIFPGTTAHVATEDVNGLDSNSAHLTQGLGGWVAVNGSCTWIPNGGDYGQVQHVTPSVGSLARIVVEGLSIPVAAGDVTFSVDAENAETTDRLLDIRFYVDGVQETKTVNLVPGSQRIFITSAVAAGNVTAIRLQTLTANPGDTTFRYSRITVREGSDIGFVPSLRIAGTLYEETLPVDMPISFAADGTPLTVGEGWAGNGVSYARYDGADASAPLVASFQAGDVPVAAQLPG